MAETITAREANQGFSRVLAEVEAGAEYVVTRNGTPVARIVPERGADGTRRLTPEQERMLEETDRWLARGWPLGDEEFDRDSLYDRDTLAEGPP